MERFRSGINIPGSQHRSHLSGTVHFWKIGSGSGINSLGVPKLTTWWYNKNSATCGWKSSPRHQRSGCRCGGDGRAWPSARGPDHHPGIDSPHCNTPGLRRNYNQCCGSMTFWCGSGSADPCLWLMDPDPTIFVVELQDVSKKLIFCLLLFEGTFTSFFKDKKSKRVTK